MEANRRRIGSYLDLVGGLLFAAFAAAMWVQRDYTSEYSGYFPDFLLIAMAVLGVGLGISAWFGRTVRADEHGDPLSGLLRAVVLLLLCFAALPVLGYVITSIVFFAVTATLMRGKSWSLKGLVVDVAVSIVFVGAIYLLFSEVLLVQLP
ncbi:tripartite tricarboxylate transporter TctB family protein [Phytoactinopolyspora halophila]|nr:tripartite tricarboxylate transporter TctB family protein [Phytoactinopolyspora halophila]